MRTRWNALAKEYQPDLILQELENLQSGLRYDQEEIWGQLLMSGLEAYLLSGFFHPQGVVHALGEQGLQAIEPHLDELKYATHLHGPLEFQWDQLDSLFQITSDLLQESDLTGSDFLRRWGWFIQQHMVCRDFSKEAQLPMLVADLVRDPLQGLRVLGKLSSQNPTLADHLDRLLAHYADLRGIDPAKQPVIGSPLQIPSKLFSQNVLSYDDGVRPFIAQHAFQDAMQPQDIAERICGDTFIVSFILESVAADHSLQLFYRAWYAFHHIEPETDDEFSSEESLELESIEGETAEENEVGLARTYSAGPQLPWVVMCMPALLIAAACVALFIVWYQIQMAQATR